MLVAPQSDLVTKQKCRIHFPALLGKSCDFNAFQNSATRPVRRTLPETRSRVTQPVTQGRSSRSSKRGAR